MSITMFMLLEQRDTISRSIASEEVLITTIESTIERLEEAAQSIENNKQEVDHSKVQLNNIVIDSSLWRGSQQRTYKEHIEMYVEDTQTVIGHIQDIQDTINAELQKRRDQLLTAQNNLTSLETSLESLNTEIQQQRSADNV